MWWTAAMTTWRPRRIAALAVGTLALSSVVRRARMVQRVPAEMRFPAMVVPVSVMGPRSLARLRRWMSTATEVHDGVSHRVVQVESGPVVHVYEPERPDDAAEGVLLWLHGGGLVMGTAHGDHAQCSRFAHLLGVPVVNVDYRLAPEHPAPAAVEDAWSALRWVLATWPDLGPDRVVVAGASAGGGLAALLTQVAHDRGVDVGLQLLV
ncbi:MAG: alpha/beta hydrolase, partial [Actinomycetales bacterium]